ncbi:glycosyltransferase family 2 protein [Cryobacterium algoricola]|uniref:glycosyltransferase family 2 protein n=1 Tax=Cryobacterium algoricola TaxID=1259183 RepID=UPI00141AE76E|nr:glycosyltransferase family 2 protein [Cryobacterium algoricola]
MSAITLNWRDTKRTTACVLSLLSEPEIHHVIVSDNESDGSLRASLGPLLDDGRISIIESEKNLGFAAGINPALLAVLDSEAEFVFVVNNDAVVEPGAIKALVHRMKLDDSLGICGPKILNPDGSVQTLGAQVSPIRASVRQIGLTGQPDYLTWAAVLMRTDAIRSVGLLDERFFMYWEDVEYCLRARDLGWGICVCESASVVHELSASGRGIAETVRRYYVESLVQFAFLRKGGWILGLPFRLVILILARIRVFDLRGGAAVFEGAVDGVLKTWKAGRLES